MTDAVTPLEILRRDGWIKGQGADRQERKCLVGAVAVALTDSDVEWRRYLDVVNEVTHEQYPERCAYGGTWGFNDHRDTTFADVELVLEKAQLRYDEALAASPVSGVSVDATTTGDSK